MKTGSRNTFVGSLFILLISMSLTVSTLHSHNHIEWHHPKNHIDTGTCLTVDSVDCPICGYFFSAYISPENRDSTISGCSRISEPDLPLVDTPHLTGNSGRSPPSEIGIS